MIVVAQPEVNEFDIVIVIKKDIFRFEVSMGDVESMKILDGIEDLIKNPTCCSFFESALCGHDSEKFSLLCEFGDQIDEIGSFDDLIQIDNVGMPNSLHYLYFSLNADFIVFVFNRFFINDLNSDLLARRYVNPFFDLPESTSTQCFSQIVVPNSFWDVLLCFALIHFLNSSFIRLNKVLHSKIIINLSNENFHKINDDLDQISHSGSMTKEQGTCLSS